VGDPDDPELVIAADKGIFRDKLPVPCDHHLGRVDALLLQDHFNGGRFLIEEPKAPVRQDQFHALWYYFAGGFLKHPGGDDKKALDTIPKILLISGDRASKKDQENL